MLRPGHGGRGGRNMGSLIRATNLWGYDDLVRELGGNPARFLERFHIPVDSQRPDDSFILYRNAAQLLEDTAVELDCPDFGLRLAKWQGLEILGAIAVIARNSNTVLDALKAIAGYLYFHCPSLILSISGTGQSDTLRIKYEIAELSPPQLRQSYELSMANGLQILKMLAGEGACLKAVSFLHGRVSSLRSYEDYFGCEVRFGQNWCGQEISASVARSAINHADPQTLHYAKKYLESSLIPGGAPLSSRVSELIRRLLPTGQCSAQTIAGELAMHPRTLQRKLAVENCRYEQLLDDERRCMAERYLGDSGFYMVQIAGLLGYTEQSTFSRACRRWFGTSPKRYRERLGTVTP